MKDGNEILEKAKKTLSKKEYNRLIEIFWYESLETFYSYALKLKLITIEDYKNAEEKYNEIWNYVGD